MLVKSAILLAQVKEGQPVAFRKIEFDAEAAYVLWHLLKVLGPHVVSEEILDPYPAIPARERPITSPQPTRREPRK